MIKGNQGLPGTLYIAPWKRVGEPLESNPPTLDIVEEPEPVERDLFQRQLELQGSGNTAAESPPVDGVEDLSTGVGKGH